MPADVALTTQRVQSYLTAMAGSVSLDSDGDYSIRSGSARVFVRISAHPNGEVTLVNVWAVVLDNVPVTPELLEYVATDNSTIFGTLTVSRRDDGSGALILRHMLLGDYLDAEELEYVVGGLAWSADNADNELAGRFGGEVFHSEG